MKNPLVVLAMLMVFSCGPTKKAPSVPTVVGPMVGAYDLIFFRVSSSDPNGDPVEFQFDWGDTTTAKWSGIRDSCDTLTVGHNYPDSGMFLFRTRARDTTGMESDWCTPETVRILGRSGTATP